MIDPSVRVPRDARSYSKCIGNIVPFGLRCQTGTSVQNPTVKPLFRSNRVSISTCVSRLDIRGVSSSNRRLTVSPVPRKPFRLEYRVFSLDCFAVLRGSDLSIQF